MTAKTIKIEAPEQLLLPVSELPHGRMYVDAEPVEDVARFGNDTAGLHGDKLSMVVTDMAGAYHVVDLYTGNLYPMETQHDKNVHPVDKFTATITLR